jgi:DNA replicative helicase MCM subunit Mcm2 (Cdc46/Mcm family)
VDECTDYQEIKIQENVQNLRVGSIPRCVVCKRNAQPSAKMADKFTCVGLVSQLMGNIYDGWFVSRSILVVLADDLVDVCRAGDDVVVVGSLVRKWRWETCIIV